MSIKKINNRMAKEVNMIAREKEELFERMPIPKAVATLAVPTVVGSLVMVLYNLADTFFVGAINQPVQTAAVTFGAPLLLAFNAVVNLFGVGTGSYISRALGVKDYDAIKKTSAFGFYGALICALIFSLCCTIFKSPLMAILGVDDKTQAATIAYIFWTVTLGAAPSILNLVISNMIRAEGESMGATIGITSGCILNIALDPIFIMPWGFNMGAAGAGCATFISNCVACSYYFVFLMKKRNTTSLSFKPVDFRPDAKVVKEVMTVGIPAAIQNLLNVTGMTVLNNFTSAYGTDAVAAMGITHKVNMVPMYFSMGFGQGIMPLVGYNFSNGNKKRMREAISFSAKISIGFIVIATSLYYIFARNIIGMFMDDVAVATIGAKLLKGFCLGLPFLCIDFLAVGIFQAVGMGKESFIFAILRKVALEVPAIIILDKIYPLYGMSYSQLVAEFILTIAALVILRKITNESMTNGRI